VGKQYVQYGKALKFYTQFCVLLNIYHFLNVHNATMCTQYGVLLNSYGLFFLCVIFRAFSFMIVIISPTHAQFTSLLYTLAYIIYIYIFIERERVYNKEVNCACVGEIITIVRTSFLQTSPEWQIRLHGLFKASHVTFMHTQTPYVWLNARVAYWGWLSSVSFSYKNNCN
jgi:hypothetical protein